MRGRVEIASVSLFHGALHASEACWRHAPRSSVEHVTTCMGASSTSPQCCLGENTSLFFVLGNRSGPFIERLCASVNLTAEAAQALKQHVITALLDMLKCHATILWSMLKHEARALHYPMRVVWMIIQTYMCPRPIRAYNNLSNMFISYQGILAGRTLRHNGPHGGALSSGGQSS